MPFYACELYLHGYIQNLSLLIWINEYFYQKIKRLHHFTWIKCITESDENGLEKEKNHNKMFTNIGCPIKNFRNLSSSLNSIELIFIPKDSLFYSLENMHEPFYFRIRRCKIPWEIVRTTKIEKRVIVFSRHVERKLFESKYPRQRLALRQSTET